MTFGDRSDRNLTQLIVILNEVVTKGSLKELLELISIISTNIQNSFVVSVSYLPVLFIHQRSKKTEHIVSSCVHLLPLKGEECHVMVAF